MEQKNWTKHTTTRSRIICLGGYNRRELPMDRVTKSQRSQIMSKIHGKDTKLELSVRRALWAKGYRFRTNYGYGKADIAFPKRKMAIFIDSCFWHACSRHMEYPKTNAAFWRRKLAKNSERDRIVTRTLHRQGWHVIRIWEHTLHNDFPGALKKIEQTITKS